MAKKNLPKIQKTTQTPLNTPDNLDLVVTCPPLVVVPENKVETLQALAVKFQKDYGPRALMRASDLEAIALRTTTIPAFDDILGGGFPVGSLIELWGEDENGKLSTLYSLMKPYGKHVLYIDAEYSANRDLMDKLGVSQEIFISHPETLEDAFNLVLEFVEKGMPLVVIDSIPALTPAKVLLEKDLSKKPGVALTAGFLTTHIYQLKRLAYRSGSIVIFTNQLRDKMNVMNQYVEQYNSPGGHALKSAYNLRVKIGRSKYIKLDKKYGSEIIGQEIAVQVYQSKVGKPMQDTMLYLVYGRGIFDMFEIGKIKKDLSGNKKVIIEGVVITEEGETDAKEN